MRKVDHVLLSRPDAIGDMVLTLPMAGALKAALPGVRITVLGRNYTRAVVGCCEHVDDFVSLDDWGDEVDAVTGHLRTLAPDAIVHALPHKTVVKAAHKARIPVRIGTGRRLYSLGRMTHPSFQTRKKSDLHEAQLGLKLLEKLGVTGAASLEQLAAWTGFTRVPACPQWALDLLEPGKAHYILHPGSRGSAVDWAPQHWAQLAETLAGEDVQLFASGTATEGEGFKAALDAYPKDLHDLSGKFSLQEFIGFIGACDGLVACSTGPLHIAAALGKKAVGLYPTLRPMHAGRWGPLGPHTTVLNSHSPGLTLDIPPAEVAAALRE